MRLALPLALASLLAACPCSKAPPAGPDAELPPPRQLASDAAKRAAVQSLTDNLVSRYAAFARASLVALDEPARQAALAKSGIPPAELLGLAGLIDEYREARLAQMTGADAQPMTRFEELFGHNAVVLLGRHDEEILPLVRPPPLPAPPPASP
jgi:hypothetical protein